jgi:hypothetical protein
MPSNFRDKNGRDPFADAEGRNPYAKDGQEVPPADEDRQDTSPTADDGPYAASAAEQYRYRPGDFEQVLPHRAHLLLGVALVGLAVGIAGIPIWYVWSIEAGVLALAATLPACALAVQDLRAMNLEAMDSSGRRLTTWALLIGVLGTAVAGVSVVLIIGRVFLWIRAASM